MAFSIQYKPLFKVNVLHQYFLNKGADEFASMPDADKEKQLAGYSLSQIFNIQLSTKSKEKMRGHHMVFKPFGSGFMVWIKVSNNDNTIPFIPIDNALEINFLLYLRNTTFFNFTELEFENAGKLFFFSNQRLASENVSFPLIKKAGTNASVNANYVLSSAGSKQVFDNLTKEESNGLFGVINIKMQGEQPGLNVINNSGKIINPYRIFELNFENRKTVWRYIFPVNQTVKNKDDVKKEGGDSKKLVTKKKQPLTQNGFVSVELGGTELPNPGANLVKPNNTNNKIYSEIYM
jgi:hypothetical protein